VTDDLVSGCVHGRHFAVEDRDEGVAAIADAIEHVTDPARALLPNAPSRQLRSRQHWTCGSRHEPSLPRGRWGAARIHSARVSSSVPAS
jgi:hypothetical protein